ncbi:MAG: hypothetical protein ACLQG3_16955 [Terracidiphilus sp.]
MYPECRHVMTSGKKCESPALKGTPFCFFHTKFHRLAHQRVGPVESLDIPVIEDRFAVQLAIGQVIKALVNDTIDPRCAALLLSALRLASINLNRGRPPLLSTIAKVVGPSSDGEEMAFDCDSVDDCEDCPLRDDCEDYDPGEEDEEGEQSEEDDNDADDDDDKK